MILCKDTISVALHRESSLETHNTSLSMAYMYPTEGYAHYEVTPTPSGFIHVQSWVYMPLVLIANCQQTSV